MSRVYYRVSDIECVLVCVGYNLIDRWAESQCSGLHNQQLYSEHKGLWEERDERSREVQNSKIPRGEEGLPSLLCLFLCFPLNRFSVCVFLGVQVVYLVYFWVCAQLGVCVLKRVLFSLWLIDQKRDYFLSTSSLVLLLQLCSAPHADKTDALIGRTLSKSIKRAGVSMWRGLVIFLYLRFFSCIILLFFEFYRTFIRICGIYFHLSCNFIYL